MKGIARALPADDPRRNILLDSALRHARATLPHIASGHYEGEHWLASFAVHLLTDLGETLPQKRIIIPIIIVLTIIIGRIIMMA